MKFSIKSKEISFFELFTASAKQLAKAGEVLAQIPKADTETRKDLCDQLEEIEHSGDEATHLILDKLNATFVTPFDREDIQSLAYALDDCIDFMESAAEIAVMYRIKSLPKKSPKVIKLLQEAAELTVSTMPKLSKYKELEDFWKEMNRIENECDRFYRQIISDLFSEERDPIEVIKVKDFADTLEKCADSFERVASIVQTIAIKES